VSFWWDPQGRVRGLWVATVFAIVGVGVDMLLNVVLAIAGLWELQNLDSPRVLLFTAPTLVAGIAATIITWIAFREPTGLSDPSPQRRLGAGFLVGGVAVAVCCVVPVLVGATSLAFTTRGAGHLLGRGLVQLCTLAPAGVGEELLMRGLGLQALRRTFG
jgi:membrane protease YdiL (CAAX protease family)